MAREVGIRVAVLVADGFEQVEFDAPVQAMREAGMQVDVLAEDEDHLEGIRGVNHFEEAEGTAGDRLLDEARPDDYDALLVPGGLASPDTMRQSEAHLRFVREMVRADKPTFVICHGGWLLADAGVAQGRRLTSWEGIRRDLERAGAEWVDEPVVVDGKLVTSRKPDDIPRFVDAILEELDVADRDAPRGREAS